MAKPSLQVIEGGASRRSDKPVIDTGVVGEKEPKFTRPKPSTGGGRGGGHAVTIAKLEESLGRAWKAILLLAAAFGAAFLFFLVRIDDRFDRVDGPVHDLTTNVAVQASTLNGIEKSLDRIEGKLDRNDQPETGAPAGEAGTVRGGTGGGAKPSR